MISLEWVSDYIDIRDEDLKELAVKITKAGINIESVIDKHINNIVIGEVTECINHPDSDHLHICKVNIGSEIIEIVCGAPNVKSGIKVIVALPGSILPGNFEIKKGNIRGQASNGMICALFELGVEEKNEENYNKGIEIVNSDIEIGTDANIYLGTNDTLYELDVHKHRNNDCYYHIGFAYEIAAIINKPVKLPLDTYKENSDDINNYMKLEIKTSKCPYYSGKLVKNITIKESPEFIKRRLHAAGIRSINNVVDISNYVMLEYGQPLHFFDKDKLGDNILVRDASLNETIKTLDEKERILIDKDIVITNGLEPVAIAGVMGGFNTEVDNNTKNIFIEAAIFDSVSIRNTANRLDLKSEASIRYGKGLSYEYTKKALDRACHLLEKYADATILSGEVLYDSIEKTENKVIFEAKDINNLLGIDLNDNDIETELNRLLFPYQKDGNKFTVTIPLRRLDIDPNINDIAEEIGRLYGYENLKSTLPQVPTKRGMYIGDVKLRKDISKRLRALGLNETKTYTLTSPLMAEKFRYENKEQIILPNPMSNDKSVIRTSLLPSLMNVYEYNKARNIKDILIYEIAKTYDINYNEESKIAILIKGNYLVNDWMHTTVKCDFYTLKGIIENLLEYLGFKNRYSFESSVFPEIHPGISAKILVDREEIGIIGRVHPNYNKDDIFVAELSMTKLYNKEIKPIKFKEASKYPEIVKDLAFVIDKTIESEVIKKQIKKSGGRLLDSIEEFDMYENIEPNKKSIAYKLTFKDSTKTLLEDEVMEVFNKIIQEVEEKTKAKLRS